MLRTRLHRAATTTLAVTVAALGGTPAIPTALAQQTASASGEVRRIDAANGKITLKHGAIPALDLSAMSLVYRIDPALLAKVKPGQQVRFTAARQGADYVVTAIE